MLANFSFSVNGTFHKFILLLGMAGDYFVEIFTRNLYFHQIISRNPPQYKRIFPQKAQFIHFAAALYYFTRPGPNRADFFSPRQYFSQGDAGSPHSGGCGEGCR